MQEDPSTLAPTIVCLSTDWRGDLGFPWLTLFRHIPVEKLLMHSQLCNFAGFNEAVYIYFVEQIWLDAGDTEARAKCNLFICVTSVAMTVVKMCY